MRILFTDHHALGDAAENLIAIRDFHDSNPQHNVCYRGFGEELFWNVPWIDWTINEFNAELKVPITMELIHSCSQNGLHVVRCIEHDIEKKTGMKIEPGALVLPITFTPRELDARPDLPERYWVIDAGGKADFETKHYPHAYFQQIVNQTKERINWVQIGLSQHVHKPLEGVINLIDKTRDLRDLLKVIHFSSGVLTPISAPLHLSAMPMHNSSNPRPCVVLGGGREGVGFTLYPNHHWFSTVGCLDCCRNKPCWRAKLLTSTDSKKPPCAHPVQIDGQWVPKCQAMIPPWLVVHKIWELAL